MWNNTLATETASRAAMWLGLHFPDLGLEIHGIRHRADQSGDLRGNNDPQATVLVDDQRVVALNGHAVAAGILCGSTLATARSICADLQVFHRDRERESERLRCLAEAMYAFSSLVSLELPDGIALEVAGSRRLYCDLNLLLERASALARSLGHQVIARLGSTPTAAMILARSHASVVTEVPLALAGLPDAQVQQLASMGIRQLGPLLDLPERELGQRFGTDLVRFLGHLTGRNPDPREGIQLRPEFVRRLHLLDPLRSKNALAQPMQQLLEELEHWLIARQLTAGELHWLFAAQSSLTDADKPENSVTMKVVFGAGRQQKRAFLPITQLRLDQIELPDDVITVGLEARDLERAEVDSHGLFTDPDMHSGTQTGRLRQDLTELQDELCARLGEGTCYSIRSVSEHVPEHAWIIRADQKTHRRNGNDHRRPGSSVRTGATDSAQPAVPNTPRRPSWLFEEPQPIPPAQLTLLQGPERIQTAWWDRIVQRDYYLARHSSGARCWVFVDVRDRWFLHGYFA